MAEIPQRVIAGPIPVDRPARVGWDSFWLAVDPVSLWRYQVFAVAIFFALFSGFYVLKIHPGGISSGVINPVPWERMAQPTLHQAV